MNSKKKGSAGERELLSILRQYGRAERNDQTFTGGKGLPDLDFWFNGSHYHVECKRQERLNLHEAIRQAERDAVDAIPVVVFRRSREKWHIVLRLEDFVGGVKE